MRNRQLGLLRGCLCGHGHTIELGGAATNRRRFIAGAAALAVVGSSHPRRVAAQVTDVTKPYRIDVHHHLSPPSYVAALAATHAVDPPMKNWTAEKSLEDMDKAGVAVAMLSVTTPGLNFIAGEAARQLARECNDYAARLVADHPGRFGRFAAVPLVDIDGSLNEIAYALDTLKADGIGMMTNYGDKWLGYPELAPVFEELNRRKVVVYTHPMSPSCCVNVVKGVSDGTVEWGADTTRTITNLIFSGASARYKDITFIFSHGGGVLTAVAERLRVQMVTVPPYLGKVTKEMVDHELKRFYYDTAQVSNEVTIQALAKLVPLSQIVFGTDFPYRTGIEHVTGLAARFNTKELAAIERGNALRFLPAWR